MRIKKRPPLTAAQKKAIFDEPEPSAESLKEMPEVDFTRAQYVGRGKQGLRRALEIMRAQKRGRPRKDAARAREHATRAKSIRLPEWAWRELARRAKSQHTTDAAIVREVLADWLERTGS